MKPQIAYSLPLFCIVLAVATGLAQPRPNGAAFLAAAKDADREIALLLPAVRKVQEAAAFLPVIGVARKLAAKTQQSGAAMSAAQYEGLQRELAAVEANLDKQLGTKADACPKSCRDAFGDGHSGGKGWNRFVCKLGCIKINSRP